MVKAPAADKGGAIHGEATLTDAQISDLNAGRWSFDIRTSLAPAAELKGPVRRTTEY